MNGGPPLLSVGTFGLYVPKAPSGCCDPPPRLAASQINGDLEFADQRLRKEGQPDEQFATVCEDTWAVVLAAGEGSRLRSLTTTSSGTAIPKQFWSLCGERSLLHEALQRATAVAPRTRRCIVVAEHHRQWWGAELSAEPQENVIVQPSNRGTAIGILLPLLHIVIRDPDARVVLLPSNHHVRDESTLAAALQEAMRQLQARRNQILLLGISPEDDDPELGYIVPGIVDGSAVRRISHLVEKPSAPLARSMLASGALWNSSIIVAHAKGLLQVLSSHFPRIVDEMQSVVERSPCTGAAPAAAVKLYRRLPDVEFSRQILESVGGVLRVLPVGRCGWSDLETPQQVANVLRRLPRVKDEKRQSRDRSYSPLSLADAARAEGRWV
jgi:mannose-1-phosphate guanylyltransferase